MLNSFCGGARAIVGGLAGNFIITGDQRSIRALFTWFLSGNLRDFFDSVRFVRFVAIDLLLCHADL